MTAPPAGWIVVLNGAPRSGKSSIAAAIQAGLPGAWLNLGVDVWMAATPERYRPGIGLRPGGERPDLEPVAASLWAALYEAAAAASRLTLNVVMDVGHHEAWSAPMGVLADCARRLAGLPALLVGVRCPIEVVMKRRNAGPAGYLGGPFDDPPAPVRRWQDEVHKPGIYDLEVDTSVMSPLACAEAIGRRLDAAAARPTALERLAG